MPVCYVEHCKTCWKPNDPYSMMHSFPRNRRLLREWLSRLPNKNLNIDQTLERILSSKQGVYRICTKHFTVDCYYATNSSRRLKKGALPTIFPLPPCKDSEDQPELDDSDQSNGLKKRKPSSFIEHSYAVTSEPITINIEPDIASEGHIQTVVEEYFTVTIE